MPDSVGQGPDRAPDRFGDGVSDGEEGLDALSPQISQVGQERFGASGAVGADEDVGAVAMGIGDLGEGGVQDGDVVARGIRAGVARPQQAGQLLARLVQEAQQRMEAEAVFVGGGCLFLLESGR